jgi:hypothetical protein
MVTYGNIQMSLVLQARVYALALDEEVGTLGSVPLLLRYIADLDMSLDDFRNHMLRDGTRIKLDKKLDKINWTRSSKLLMLNVSRSFQ